MSDEMPSVFEYRERGRAFTAHSARESDLAAVKALYYEVIEYFNATVNYTAWAHNAYPTDETAESAFSRGELHVLYIDGEFAGAVVLNHNQDPSYRALEYAFNEKDPNEVLVVHTLAVRPCFRRMGAGRALMNYAESVARAQGAAAMRLDTAAQNLPGLRLYEQCGFRRMGRVVLSNKSDVENIEFWHVLEKVL